MHKQIRELSRFKNYGVWFSIFVLIPIVLKGIGLNIIPDDYDRVVTRILTILVSLGILINRIICNKGYLDNKDNTNK
ncbi:holin [Clostridium mediterraneense]|uniref:holin n=1 Tax=Clostridium mediterraneense TaxID=1805472 RepID=UPI001F1EB2EA|nr:holin [Clostridium mediterraneense]